MHIMTSRTFMLAMSHPKYLKLCSCSAVLLFSIILDLLYCSCLLISLSSVLIPCHLCLCLWSCSSFWVSWQKFCICFSSLLCMLHVPHIDGFVSSFHLNDQITEVVWIIFKMTNYRNINMLYLLFFGRYVVTDLFYFQICSCLNFSPSFHYNDRIFTILNINIKET